jgi:HemY protein
MIRLVAFLVVLALIAFGLSWLLDHPGGVTVEWLGQRAELSVFHALGFVLVACIVFTLLWSLLTFLFRVPTLMSLARRARRHARGRDALSRGMIAVGAGDLRGARRASNESARMLPRDPMQLLLRAQVAQMEGDRAEAEAAFTSMAERDDTRILGLRGLHVEATRRGDAEAAHHFAREAHRVAPLAWAGEAIVAHHAARAEWSDALATVESNQRAKVIDAATAARQRAVLETAIAQEDEFVNPDEALRSARSAAKRAPDLVPAVALAARLMSRRGEFRAASKLIERAWEAMPHPELAAAYFDMRPGDSSADRLARAMMLTRRTPDDPVSRLFVAGAALAARDFAKARSAMAPLVSDDARPTAHECLMMADIEEAENGDTGLLREWLARASRAPRDATWVADGVTSARWAPVSPVTGKLDAFRWQTPREELTAGPREPVTAPMAPLPTPAIAAAEAATVLPPVVAQPVVVPPPDPEPVAPALEAEPEPDPAPALPPPVDRKPTPDVSIRPVIFPLATSPDDPGPRPSGAPYSGGFR